MTGDSGRGAEPPSGGWGPPGPPYGQPPGGPPPAAPPPYGPQAPYGRWPSQQPQQPPGPQARYGWQPGYGPQQPVPGQPPWGQPPGFPPPRRRGRKGVWLGAGVTIIAIIVVVAVALSLGSGTGTRNQSSPASPGQGSGSGQSPPCPATPVAGPAHTLTFPQSIDGYTIADGPTSADQLTLIGQNACIAGGEYYDYQNSQGSFVRIEAGHHADLWHSFDDFWGSFFSSSQASVVMVSAGPLGGQAGCGTDAEGTSCTWLDNDTFGAFTPDGSSLSASQTASLMLTFRNAVEQAG
jgi:hypothetical protein